ncbi:hypothetical protein AB4Z29_28855 [Paenibacillus sp. 2TAB23]|uniref:hypothetical protein n=1 Tax=Paenibacillus sp. 2TAB23 TaxID=3233004 RepID=UPI003F9AB699
MKLNNTCRVIKQTGKDSNKNTKAADHNDRLLHYANWQDTSNVDMLLLEKSGWFGGSNVGISIHYEGTASSSESVFKKPDQVKIYSNENNWSIDEIGNNKIVVTPHAKCESLSFTFNEKSKFSGSTKTGFAPTEIHEQIVKLFYEIKLYKLN